MNDKSKDGFERLNEWRAAIESLPETESTSTSPDDVPDAYGARVSETGKWAYIWHEKDDVQGWLWLQHQSQDNITYAGPIPLYTRPQSDELRKAAEELLEQINLYAECKFGWHGIRGASDKLRAALKK